MRIFNFGRPNHDGTNRNRHQIRPVVEGFESRLLLSGASIAGTALKDITGNGSSWDDSPLPSVTVNLYQNGNSTALKSTTTDSKGNYSFTGLSSGAYSVQQVVPANDLPTMALNGYSVTLKSGQQVVSQNFDDFHSGLYSTSTISKVEYTVTTPDGKTVTHPTTLAGNVQQGDTVSAHFLLSKPEMVELVAYVSPDGTAASGSLKKQVIFSDQESWTTSSGAQEVSVTVPNGYFQLGKRSRWSGSSSIRMRPDSAVRLPTLDQAAAATGGFDGISDGAFSPESRAWKQLVR